MIRSSRFVRSALAVASAGAASLSFVAATPAPASADTLVGVLNCTAQLPQFPAPAGNVGTCNGTASGVHNGSALALAPFGSSFSYVEPCPPAIGTASGTTTFNGQAGPNFSWTRVGLTAVIVLNHGGTSGAAAGIFVPTTVLGAGALTPPCSGAGPVTAAVVAVGVDAL